MVGRPKKHSVFKGALNACAIKGAFLPRKGKKKKKEIQKMKIPKCVKWRKIENWKDLQAKFKWVWLKNGKVVWLKTSRGNPDELVKTQEKS